MSSPRLKVGGFDFSPYLRTQPDESPAADAAGAAYFRPQFSGTPALSEGSSWVGDAVDNRTMVFPLYFTANTRAEIQALIREADLALVKGAQVEFAIDPSVDPSSFFDLERGVLAEEFNVYHLINGIAGAVLTLTVRPYANTATHRLIASIPAATSAVVEFAASGIMGDAYALANLEVRVGSAVASAGRVIAWGVHPHPSYNPYRAATSGLAQTGATVRGASGAIGSQYTAIPVSPTGASGIAYTAFLDPVSAHVGRHRVIAIGRSGLNVPIPLWAEDRFGAVLGATALASQTDLTKWQVIDLGEVNVPARASGQEAVPTQYVNVRGGGASGAGVNASPGFHLNGLLFLPLDYSAGVLRTAGGEPAFITDSFKGVGNLENLPADTGQAWTSATGYMRVTTPDWVLPNQGSAHASAALYDVASGALYTNIEVSVKLGIIAQPSALSPSLASGLSWDVWAKRTPGAASQGVWASFQAGPSQTLNLLAGNGVSATVLASAGIASTLASSIYEGFPRRLVVRVMGEHADVWLASPPAALPASPILSANSPWISQAGNPAFRITPGGTSAYGATGPIFRSPFVAAPVGGTSPDIGAREWFRFESHPEGRVYQGNASVFAADRLANYRGQFPKMPPVGSGAAATGPARVVVLQAEVDNVQGLDGPDIALTVLERFRFLAG